MRFELLLGGVFAIEVLSRLVISAEISGIGQEALRCDIRVDLRKVFNYAERKGSTVSWRIYSLC